MPGGASALLGGNRSHGPNGSIPSDRGEGRDSAHVGPSKETNSSGSSWETPKEIRAPAELRDPIRQKGPKFKE